MKLLRLLICMTIPTVYMGCSSCSDQETMEKNFKEEMDRQSRALEVDPNSPEALAEKIEVPCREITENRTLNVGDYTFVCRNGKWLQKD